MFEAKILPPPSLGPPINIEKTHRRRGSLFARLQNWFGLMWVAL